MHGVTVEISGKLSMLNKMRYKTPDGMDDILLVSDGDALVGLNFIRCGGAAGAAGAQVAAAAAGNPDVDNLDADNPAAGKPAAGSAVQAAFRDVVRWLDIYFSGKEPDFMPSYKIEGATEFQKEVYSILSKIPYGQTVTYGEIAAVVAEKRGISRMSAQAVGGAVGKNPVAILLPCHRVLGKDGSLTGFAGGLNNKVALLKLESVLTDHAPDQFQY